MPLGKNTVSSAILLGGNSYQIDMTLDLWCGCRGGVNRLVGCLDLDYSTQGLNQI